MAKRFFYVCLGLLAIVLSYHVGARDARGQGTFFRLIGINAAIVGNTAYLLDITNPTYGWKQMPYSGADLPPVPVASLVSFESDIAITDSGEGWIRNADAWVSLGFLPGSPQPTRQATWGAVKARYR